MVDRPFLQIPNYQAKHRSLPINRARDTRGYVSPLAEHSGFSSPIRFGKADSFRAFLNFLQGAEGHRIWSYGLGLQKTSTFNRVHKNFKKCCIYFGGCFLGGWK